jgi:hypothetical protein
MANNITQTKKHKERYEANHFDIMHHPDFITDKSKFEFKHICGSCSKSKYCQKGKAAIILKCVDYREKEARDEQRYKKASHTRK